MPTYRVVRKADQAEVYRYQADAVVEWAGYEYLTHDHVEVTPPPAPPVQDHAPVLLTKLQYLRRFTQLERITIRTAAAQSPALADYLHMLELAEEINLADPDTVAAVQMLEGAGLIAQGRTAEILNG